MICHLQASVGQPRRAERVVQRLDGSAAKQLPAIDQRHVICVGLGLFEVVRGEHDVDAFLCRDTLEVGPERISDLGVQADGRLIQLQNARPMQTCAQDLDASFLSAGQAACQLAGTRGHTCKLQQRTCPAPCIGDGHGMDHRVQLQIFVDGEVVVQGLVLEHNAELVAYACSILHYIVPCHRDRAAAWAGQRRHHPDGGCLAGVIGAEQSEEGTGSDGKRQIGDDSPSAIALFDLLEFDDGSIGRRPSCCVAACTALTLLGALLLFSTSMPVDASLRGLRL